MLLMFVAAVVAFAIVTVSERKIISVKIRNGHLTEIK